MPNCLGIYIDENVIKYAKVAKEREDIKIESYGIKFYDDIEETIKQIVEETYSYKTPISTNISDVQYTYVDMFNLLNKRDLAKAIDTEFELFCSDNGKNRAAIEYKTLQVPKLMDTDKITTIYTYANKSSIVSRLKDLSNSTVSSITPTALAIPMLNNYSDGKNSIIVNIEDITTVTTVVNGLTYKVDVIENGMGKVLKEISAKENSNQKAYEICKNTTVYTMETSSLQMSENEYLTYIMPTIYSIIEEVKEVIAKNEMDITNIYITGLATAINNIDLYFQDNFPEKKCEILTPFFADTTNIKLNIKDYIEVNSAVALALNYLIPSKNTINFKEGNLKEKISVKIPTKSASQKAKQPNEVKNKTGSFIKMDLGTSLDTIEKALIRTCVGLLILMISYFITEKVILNKIEDKQKQVQAVIADTQNKISAVNKNITRVQSKTTEYEEFITKINEANSQLSEYYASKNSIPILLNNIQAVIPDGVQLLSLENTTGKHIQIKAQTEKYEQIGFFVAKLKTDGILVNITSDSGTKTANLIQVTIEGDLPY